MNSTMTPIISIRIPISSLKIGKDIKMRYRRLLSQRQRIGIDLGTTTYLNNRPDVVRSTVNPGKTDRTRFQR